VRDDDREIAKVLDFGIAKATGAGVAGSSTRTGAMLGTPYYMSPEQAQGTRAVDSRSDLWALAVIVFEALTGRRPFESEALGDLLMRIIVAPIPMPSAFVPDLPPALDAWWARGSQRDPAQRFQSARELCDSLALVFGRASGDLGELSNPLGKQVLARAPQPSPPNAQFPGPAPAPPPDWRQTPAQGQSPPVRAETPGQAPAAQAVEAASAHLRSNPRGPGLTEAGIARTFGDRPGSPRRTGILMGAAAGIVVLGGMAVGVSVAFRGRGEDPAEPGRHAAAAENAGRPPLEDAGAPVRLVPTPPTGMPAPEPNAPSFTAGPSPPAAIAPSPTAGGPAPAAAPPHPAHAQPPTAIATVHRPSPQAAPAPPSPAASPAKSAEDPKKKTVDLGI
ncbi:MAG: protein kinase, partial [Myxococcales bacterium]|nr:protein kinase [Myxococcales bacterium]